MNDIKASIAIFTVGRKITNIEYVLSSKAKDHLIEVSKILSRFDEIKSEKKTI